MISQPLFIVLVAAFLTMLFVWSSARKLIQDQEPIGRAFPKATTRDIVRALAALPVVLAALHLALVWVLDGQGDPYVRLAQGLLFLGWWASIVIMLFSQAVALRSSSSWSAVSVIGMGLSAVILVLFSSSAQFAAVFEPNGYDRAIIVGVALALMAYTVVRRLWQARPSK